ncbi:Uncharacterised protein [Lysinibacillus sphaericus]|uniref:Uncharacterized protein n=3 Tax=Lysinibacillus sphaericus TaxID=1421 RepID=A0A2S0JYQ1_LYSSH|nr:hypothetical protein LS41612_08325 [Lysinibacillus sphaericus]SUV17970.1 Uncharacterised protein [Lysinibacillus sphaericus]
MFYKYLTYCLQDIRLKKLLFWIVACFMIMLHLFEVLPITSVANRWHTLKDFIVASRYEHFYIPVFLLLLAPFSSKDNDWLLLRRYRHRQQFASYKVCFVFIVTAFFTAIVFGSSLLSTSLAKSLFSPYLTNYSALLLYVPEPKENGSLLYFIYMFYCVTVIFGLLYIVFQQLFKNNFISAIIVMILGMLDRYIKHFVFIAFHKSEYTSPISSFFILVAVTILLINAIHYLVNKLDFYVRDDDS